LKVDQVNWEIRKNGVQSLAFSPNGKWLMMGTRGGAIHGWALSQENPKAFSLPVGGKAQAHYEHVTGMAFDPQGWFFVSCSRDKTIKVWECDGWKPRRSIKCDNPLHSVGFSPDGKLLACATEGEGVLFYDMDLVLSEARPKPRLQTHQPSSEV